jgi:hypothetical protein
VILHSFSSVGWEAWGLSGRPLILEAMPVLVDDDLRFEDAKGPRPTVAMNRWLGNSRQRGAIAEVVAYLCAGAQGLGGVP